MLRPVLLFSHLKHLLPPFPGFASFRLQLDVRGTVWWTLFSLLLFIPRSLPEQAIARGLSSHDGSQFPETPAVSSSPHLCTTQHRPEKKMHRETGGERAGPGGQGRCNRQRRWPVPGADFYWQSTGAKVMCGFCGNERKRGSEKTGRSTLGSGTQQTTRDCD